MEMISQGEESQRAKMIFLARNLSLLNGRKKINQLKKLQIKKPRNQKGGWRQELKNTLNNCSNQTNHHLKNPPLSINKERFALVIKFNLSMSSFMEVSEQ